MIGFFKTELALNLWLYKRKIFKVIDMMQGWEIMVANSWSDLVADVLKKQYIKMKWTCKVK